MAAACQDGAGGQEGIFSFWIDQAARQVFSWIMRPETLDNRCSVNGQSIFTYKKDGSGRGDVAKMGRHNGWSKQREIDTGRSAAVSCRPLPPVADRISDSRSRSPNVVTTCSIKDETGQINGYRGRAVLNTRSGHSECVPSSSSPHLLSPPPTSAQHVWHCRHPPASDQLPHTLPTHPHPKHWSCLRPASCLCDPFNHLPDRTLL